MANNHLNVDIIIQSTTNKNTTDLSFSIHSEDLKDTLQVLADNKESLKYENVQFESDLAKVSIVGSGMVSNPGVAAKMFEVLANESIEVKMVSTSEIKVSTVVEEGNMIRAVDSLHQAFELAGTTVKS